MIILLSPDSIAWRCTLKIFPRISIETSAARCTLVLVLLCLLVCDSLAADVLDIANAYKDGGGYDSSWNGSGAHNEIRFGGQRILANGMGTYCWGFTFAVAMDAARAGFVEGKNGR